MKENNASQMIRASIISSYLNTLAPSIQNKFNSIISGLKIEENGNTISDFSNRISQKYEKELPNSHSTGSYYTPPQLTRWICEAVICKMFHQKWISIIKPALISIQFIQQWIESNIKTIDLSSIKNWLYGLRICDNACGSGEFLIQMVKFLDHFLSMVENNLDNNSLNDNKAKEWERKKLIVEKMVYGIDKNPEAVELTKFRLWLCCMEGYQAESIETISLHHICCGDSLVDFNWKVEFPEIFSSKDLSANGFDLIIGNPPYIKSRKQDWDTNSGSKSKLIEIYKTRFPSLKNSLTVAFDYSMYFILNSVYYLREEGWNCYLITNKWIRATYGQSIRQLIANELFFDSLIELSDNSSFKNANVDLCIYFIQKTSLRNPHTNYAKFYPEATNFEGQAALIQWKNYNQRELGDQLWNFQKTNLDNEIISWVSTRFSTIKEKHFIYGKGLETGANNVFMITTSQRSKFIAQNSENDRIIKPFILGEGINPFSIKWDEKWLLFIPWHFPFHESKKDNEIQQAEQRFKQQFPEIYVYLEHFKNELEKRAPSEKGHYEWYALKRFAASYYRFFSEPKIMWQELAAYGKFAWDPIGYFPGNSAYMITKCPSALTIILNSNVVDFYFGHISKTIGKHARRHTTKFVEQIRIPDAPPDLSPLVEYLQFEPPSKKIMKKIEALNYELYFIDKFVVDGTYPQKQFYILDEFLKELQPITYNDWMREQFVLSLEQDIAKSDKSKSHLAAEMKERINIYFSRIETNELIEKWENIIFSHPWIQYLEQKRLKRF